MKSPHSGKEMRGLPFTPEFIQTELRNRQLMMPPPGNMCILPWHTCSYPLCAWHVLVTPCTNLRGKWHPKDLTSRQNGRTHHAFNQMGNFFILLIYIIVPATGVLILFRKGNYLCSTVSRNSSPLHESVNQSRSGEESYS